MVEHAADYEWRGEGEAAEIVLYAPDARVAGSAFERVLPAARLPGIESPVYAASSPEGLGWAAVSASHAAPDLTSIPLRGLLLVADAALESLGVPPEEVPRLVPRRFSEVRLPHLTGSAIRRICETGARATAEDGLIEEEDLPLLDPLAGEADALGRRALSAGERDPRPGEAYAFAVGEVLDAEATEGLGLQRGALVLVVSAGAGDLGRLALAGHRERIAGRVRGGDLGAEEDLPAAPVEAGEAADLLAALYAAANFADGRAALLVYALRRALERFAGSLSLRAAWRVGGIEERDGSLVHRSDLAARGGGEALVTGGSVAAGTGKMSGSVPPFGAPEDGGAHLWEEAGLLERWAGLDPPEGKS
jgi:tRNA-splicing ligase RtcB (3'-phosphate/5'-hydroxy nucleic acid ligase)